MDRSFIVHTPLGKLRVYAKHDVDCAEDYPGVYIELIENETDKYGEVLCCIEYDSCNERLQSVVYQPYTDEPVELVVHEIEEE